MSLYNNALMRVRLPGNILSKIFYVTEGLLQGDPINPSKIDIHILLFTDDIIILAKDAMDLQSKLDTLNKYCKLKRLTVNIDKTKIIKFQKAGRQKKERTFRYDSVPIETVTHYTYLGVIFSSSGNFTINAEYATTKGKLYRGKKTSWTVGIKLFDALVASTTLYSIGVWGLNSLYVIEKIQLTYLKRMLQLPRCTPGYLIHLETGTCKLESSILKRAIAYWLMDQSRYTYRMNSKLVKNHQSGIIINLIGSPSWLIVSKEQTIATY